MLFSETIKEKIAYLDFQVYDSEKSPVVFVSELEKEGNTLTASQIIALEDAKYYRADAVFFRYFDDAARPPQAQIYIYDNGTGTLNGRYEQIHKELWSSCTVPIFIIVEDFKIRIFDSRKPVKIGTAGKIYTKEIASLDTRQISEYSDVIEKYNAQKFSDGTFWDSQGAQGHFSYNKTPYKDLIDNLKILRQSYKTENVSSHLSDYIIIISILIKYLEENGIDEEGNNLADSFFFNAVGCHTFLEILEKNKLVNILEALAKKFNGGIFSINASQKSELRKADLSQIARFFDAKVDYRHQLVLWPLYSFKHIPVELISNIYEEFIPDEDKGAVYTPHYLVNLLIDECIPLPSKDEYETANEDVKLIDISCGSGIFLVNAFRRLVQIYQLKQYYKTGRFSKKIPIKKLHNILNKNIFGVDINPNAVNLTKFSLSLAICQMLSPRQIWTELAFEDLGAENIQNLDFFEFISDRSNHKKYNLVIGNPPFNPPIEVNGAQRKSSDYIMSVEQRYNFKSEPIGDNDLALYFLQHSIKLLKARTGLLCLVQKSIPLLHTKENESFRGYLFEGFHIPQIIDFTPYRRILFPNVTVPTCAFFLENKPPSSDYITHIVIKRTKSGKEKLFFEIDSYDIHFVAREKATKNISWKSNLFGGYRLLNLVEKLNGFPKVKDLISNEVDRKGGWTVQDLKKYISSGLFLPTRITHGKFPEPITNPQDTNRSTWGLIGDPKIIRTLSSYFKKNGNLLCTYISGTSTRQGIDRTYDLYTEDIRNLPVLSKDELDKLSIADQILIHDIAKYKITEFGDPENAESNKEISARGTNVPPKLLDFSETYIAALNSAFKKNTKQFYLNEVSHSRSSFIMEFEYKTADPTQATPILKSVKSNMEGLTEFSRGSISIKRISVIYSGNRIVLIKPKQLRFWLKMLALVDADSSIADIINYNHELTPSDQ